MSAVTTLAEVLLVVHQRHSIRACLCGWDELGRSHARHQIEMLDEAGLLSGSYSRKPWFPATQPPKGSEQVDVITVDGKIIPAARVEGLWITPVLSVRNQGAFFTRQVAYWRPANG